LEVSCTRCHETVREADRYCPACGLPQLTYLAAEAPLVALGSDSVPPPLGEMAAVMNGIQWRQALRAAIMLGVPVGFLCASFWPAGLVCTAGGAAWAVSIYARRVRKISLSAGTGAQIGMVFGLVAGWLTVAMCGFLLWTARFVLHQGGVWDTEWQRQVEKSFGPNAIASQGGTISLEWIAMLRTLSLSVDGRAGIPLVTLLVLGCILIILAVAGGVMGARFVKQPRIRA
jgi:hypothetical protein